jgi:tetratricopeptide (TPR) repeat protein
MSNAAKLKKRAVELEQKKQFDKALPLYIQFLQESGSALDDVDIPLYNRVGDLLLRMGNASDALNYYEQAVDLYAERGFLNNAIALCNKVLQERRQEELPRVRRPDAEVGAHRRSVPRPERVRRSVSGPG